MKIGIIFDTCKSYNLELDNEFICDFSDELAVDSIIRALHKLGHTTELFTAINQLDIDKLKKCDLIFNTFEGIQSRNREVMVSSFLEMHKLPFIGADAYIGIVTLDKYLCKLVAKDLGIDVPKAIEITKDTPFDKIENLKLPIIIKPNYEGNSAGTAVFNSYQKAKEFLLKTSEIYKNLSMLCEEFIEGQELTVPIIGNGANARVVGITTYKEQATPSFWLDYKYKLFGGFTDCVAELSNSTQNDIINKSLDLYKKLGFIDYSRFDFRLDKDGKAFFLEANAYPTLCEHGSFSILFQQNGKSFLDVVNEIVQTSYERIYGNLLPK